MILEYEGATMFQALVAVYGILTLAILACIRYTLKSSNTANRRSMIALMGTAVLTAAGYTASILVPANHSNYAVMLTGVYYIATDWLAMTLIYFVADYTRIHPPTKAPRVILLVLAAGDTVSLIANTFTRHMFTMVRGSLDWADYWHLQIRPAHFLHLGFVYLMAMYSVALLLYRTVKAPKIYKSKYGVILGLILAVVAINGACVALEAEFDYSVLIYGLLAIAISYFVLYASPRNLLESMHSSLVEDSVIGLFVYDDNKQCVGANRAARELFGEMSDEIYRVAEQYLAKWEADFEGNMRDVMGEERQVVRGGETMYVYVNYQKLLDSRDRVLGSGFQFEDRTAIVQQYEENKYKATHDPLTGLLNRDAFERRVTEILSGSDETYYMMCSNIKDFKLINELCGSDVGDRLLMEQANVIRSDEAGDSISTRMYADKFCTLLPSRDYDEEGFAQTRPGSRNPFRSLSLSRPGLTNEKGARDESPRTGQEALTSVR